jgi:hypothetical protein
MRLHNLKKYLLKNQIKSNACGCYEIKILNPERNTLISNDLKNISIILVDVIILRRLKSFHGGSYTLLSLDP